MKKLLIAVDMQNDFIDGSLGTAEAQAVVSNLVEKIKNWNGDIICTRDTHNDNYLNTREGKYLSVPHCIQGTEGHKLNHNIQQALNGHDVSIVFDKYTFGSTALPEIIRGHEYNHIELAGLCTDICVISNAMLLKAAYPETDISIDASCCAGVTPESHKNALAAMKMCQINIINEEE